MPKTNFTRKVDTKKLAKAVKIKYQQSEFKNLSTYSSELFHVSYPTLKKILNTGIIKNKETLDIFIDLFGEEILKD